MIVKMTMPLRGALTIKVQPMPGQDTLDIQTSRLAESH